MSLMLTLNFKGQEKIEETSTTVYKYDLRVRGSIPNKNTLKNRVTRPMFNLQKKYPTTKIGQK